MRPLLLVLANLFVSSSIYAQCSDEVFSIGDTWTYQVQEYNSLTVGFLEMTIADTTSFEGHTVYLFDYNNERFYIDQEEVYYWDHGLQEYIMHYDFSNDDPYTIRYSSVGGGSDLVAEVLTDTSYISTIGGFDIETKEIRLFNSETYAEGISMKIYKYWGNDRGMPRLNLGCGLCDPSVSITDLRCISTPACMVTIGSIDCDSVSVSTSTEDFFENKSTTQIYPTPATDIVKVHNFNPSGQKVYLSIINMAGNKMLSTSTTSQYMDINVRDFSNGVYFVYINYADGSSSNGKLVVSR